MEGWLHVMLVHWCNSDGFFHMEAPDYTVPPRTIERSHSKTSGSCDSG